jgi:hypothetical protein
MTDLASIMGVAIEDVAKIDGVTIATGYSYQGFAITLELQGDIGLFAGGHYYEGSATRNTITYITITSTGDASDFGDLTTVGYWFGLASSTRGIFTAFNYTNVITYVTINTKGNAADFGDLLNNCKRGACVSSNTRGVVCWGWTSFEVEINNIDYITIATEGNGTNFGDLQTLYGFGDSGLGSTTRGLVAGGFNGAAYSNVIEYITIATPSNSTDFGDLSSAKYVVGMSSSTRGVWTTTANDLNSMQYVTIASTGDTSDFGDLLTNGSSFGAAGNATRGVWGGGGTINTIEYITFASTGNTTLFGEIPTSGGVQTPTGLSNCHGGL